MARTIHCFVSFSAVDGDETAIKFLLKHLEERCQQKVKFLAYFDNRSGSDLAKFMEEDLRKSEAIMALFTPDYKRKCDNHIKSGVLTEYMQIVSRLEGRQNLQPPLFIPILWKNDFGESLPAYFNGRELTRDLRQFKPFPGDGSPYLPDRVAQQVRPVVSTICEELDERWREVDPALRGIQDKISNILLDPSAMSADEMQRQQRPSASTPAVKEAFFRKAERTRFTLEEFSDKFFTKTSAFRAIGSYHKLTFTGRKGSGKTTLLKVYKHQNADLYFSPIDVEVNDWNLHFLLQDLTFRATEGDLTYTAEESKIFDFIWPVFLSLCMVRSLLESDINVSLSGLISKREYQERFKKDRIRYETLFQMSVGVVKDFIEECISNASTENEWRFKADLLSSVNVRACIEFFLGGSFSGVLSAVNGDREGRRFLFCLDRFDTEIQKYRKDLKDRNLPDDERRRWEQREVFWIQGLVEMIDHLRSPDFSSPNQEFYKLFGPHVDFCVPLPRDRVYEVQLRRRDAIVGDISEEINWQPYELLTMLRKRLQEVWQIPDELINKKEASVRQRFEQVRSLSGRHLPDSVDVKINGAAFPIDLFLNVLRHSFFRPRDVLLHYTRIVARAELALQRKEKVSPTYVARVISEETHRIVEDEFLGEFADTFPNLREVLDSFKASPQIMNFDEIKGKLESLRFEIYGREDIRLIGEKVKILYEIGFLGIKSDKVQLGGLSSNDFDFYFFNPRYASNLVREEVLSSLAFAIHPVFIEHLTLKMNGKRPVMLLTWDQVEELDVFE